MTLSKEVFKKGIDKIELVFDDFKMNDKKAEIWYEYSKDLTEDKFLYRIKNCIRGCRKIPSLADILDWKNYYVNEKEEADLRAKKEELENNLQKKREQKEREKITYNAIPEEAKEIIKKVIPGYGDKIKRQGL